jgi:hypothetical protein
VARVLDMLRSPFSFLFARTQKEELIANYIMREHARGRSLSDILDDAYVTNRLTPEQVKRLFDRPDMVSALGHDTVSETQSKLGESSSGSSSGSS